MKVLWESEEWPGARVDPGVTCLSWIPCKESGSGGFLGSGSESGAVGVTRTELCPSVSSWSSHADKRFNFNLRGHHSPISLVAWNVAQTKLASCDESGIIYVWVPNEERWSVELVNDRGVKVRDFSWSPSGSSALICYEDNFVLIGSATGQRIWSNSFAQTVLCGVWAHDSREIIIGLNTGSILVLTEQGATVTERTIWADNAIEQLACSAVRTSDGRSTLCACFAGGQAHFLRSYDDPDPVVFTTELKIVAVQWSSNGEYLALAATSSADDSGNKRAQCVNQLFLFNGQGVCLQVVAVPVSTDKRLTAFTWAHDDQVVVLAAGGDVAVGRVVHTVPPLFLLASYRVWGLLGGGNEAVESLPLPTREKAMVLAHNDHIIQCRIPAPRQLCRSVCHPSCWRWYCTIRPVPRKAQTYMLCMEHMGGLVPVLIGRQINRLLPEFEIRLPKPSPNYRAQSASRSRSRTPDSIGITADVEDKTSDSPFQRSNLQRNSVWRRSKRQLRAIVHRAQQHAQGSSSAKYEEKLVQVTSNVWCTRFKVTGMSPSVLPPYLGQVVYKTSVLHLQPRQMTVHVVDLERRSALTAPVAPPLDVDVADSGTDENLLAGQIDGGMPVAPLDGEIFVGVGGPAAGGLPDPLDDADTDELLAEEQALLHHVLAEFSDLRAAVDRHINRMRDFAADLQRSSQQLHNGAPRAQCRRPVSVVGQVGGSVSSSSSPRRLSVHSIPATAIAVDERKIAKKLNSASGGGAAIAAGCDSAPPTGNRWENQLEALQFIDEDESLVVTSEAEQRRLRPRTLSASDSQGSSTRPPIASRYGSERTTVGSTSSSLGNEENRPAFSRPTGGTVVVKGPGARQLTEITSVLDKLYKLANELTARPGVSDGGRASGATRHAPHIAGKVSPHRRQQTPAVQDTRADDGTETVAGVTQLRSRIREIAQRVGQLERRINFGNELLDEVRGDLHQRVQHIRAVLGEQQLTMSATDGASADGPAKSNRAAKQQEPIPASDDHNAVLVLQNKTPFWNEQSQVYQLDFGGRVTQESAKNFQIEHQERQVMQFGRIENGSYTLDFRSPFSAVQAFSVALASITQRLK